MKNIKNEQGGFIVPLIIIAIVVIIIVAVTSSGDNGNSNNSNTDATENSQSQSEEAKEGLAYSVEKKYLEFWGVSNLEELRSQEGVSLNIRSITKFEDYGSGNVLVHVQEDISEDEAKEVGKNVMGAVGLDVKEVDFIVVRGTDGRDVNVSRNDIPALRQ